MNLPVIPTIKSVTDLRYQTADIIRLLSQDQPIVVTRDNTTVAIMLSPKQYQQIVYLFEEREDEQATKKLEKAIERGGRFTNFQSFDKRQRKKLELP